MKIESFYANLSYSIYYKPNFYVILTFTLSLEYTPTYKQNSLNILSRFYV